MWEFTLVCGEQGRGDQLLASDEEASQIRVHNYSKWFLVPHKLSLVKEE